MCIEEIGTPCEIPDSVPTNDDAQSRFYICMVNYQYDVAHSIGVQTWFLHFFLITCNVIFDVLVIFLF